MLNKLTKYECFQFCTKAMHSNELKFDFFKT